MMEEMSPLFEEFCAIIGCDPNAHLVKHEVKIGYVRSFESLFQFSRPQAKAMIVGDQKAILLPLIDEFSEVHSDDPDRMRLRMRALVFCLLAGFLFNKDLGFGDLRLCPMIRQMEDMGCIDGIVLAETIRSLDRAALGFDDWTVSPIILQVWLKDHLRVVAAPTLLPYSPSQYCMRRILITYPSTVAWTSWLIELGPNEVLWFISWYDITRFIQLEILIFHSFYTLHIKEFSQILSISKASKLPSSLASLDLSDEDFLASLGISLDDVNLTADADTHASVTGIFALTWAFEYFPYTRLKLIHADLGLGLVPSAWRWYRSNLQTGQRKKSLRDLRAFFDTCTLTQVEVGAMAARLQSWIQVDSRFQRSDALSRRRVVLSHPVLRRYYLGERVDLHVRGCRSVPYSPPEDMRAGKQMTLTTAHTEGIPHVEFILEGDYDEFCRISLMQPIGSRLDDLQRSAPSQPLGTRSSRASGPSPRTPRRRPLTDPTSSTLVEGLSQAGPSCSAGPSKAPRAILEAFGPLLPNLANLRLPYSIPYYPPDDPPALREVSLDSVDRSALPSEDITEVPVGLVNQMMELMLGMQQELTSAWTHRAFDDQRRRRLRR
ncbi:hypothetical protein JCGZ_10315 [Jatropha curcas]|uniref:Aminotransferase-like plant mobile domain-containing protein n=1 Tax=Jatropha curcas TaxID=180498 RepID=A0A067KM22_JATCU|nr:hypothetical protein JCGZ_10315 [Jatropha curcas]